ncbi:restriction endonuclease PLD domain-containing protein [Companilactobacillus zhachilii]|uniref:restriction endonuclease PLD domain-containing protein n=1 Tax=Companilactobacillus zhachilii TaxID=2304606 RepID=UPI0040349730
MKNLYSNVSPVPILKDSEIISDAIKKAINKSDKLEIAVGYVSIASLRELNRLIINASIKNVVLVIGMYASGIPSNIYNECMSLQEDWTKKNIGSIYYVNNMKYHGKSYIFIKDNSPFKAIVGSANLSVLYPEGSTIRQYEVATVNDDINSNNELSEHIHDVIRTSTRSIMDMKDVPILKERIDALDRIQNVIEITQSELSLYTKKQNSIQFRIPIKAPSGDKKFSTEKKDYAKSNINVCYGKGRLNTASGKIDRRDWYETQITVSKKITSQLDYPKDKPFYIITDDKYKFIAHTTADNNKQLTAYGISGNDRVFGRWIKGRLVTAGLIKPFDDVSDDVNGEGIVTEDILDKAHMRVMVLTKTNIQEFGEVYKRKAPTSHNKKGMLDKNKVESELLDVWTVHFEDLKENE